MRFHPEILRVIFKYIMLSSIGELKAAEAPLLLTHVCSQWRAVAIEDSSLWSRIVIPRWVQFPKDVVNLLGLWLNHSKKSLLDVSILLPEKLIHILPMGRGDRLRVVAQELDLIPLLP